MPDLALWFVEGGIVGRGGDDWEPPEYTWECAPVVAETRAKAKHLFLDHPNTYSLWLEWTDLRCRLLTRDIGAALREAGPQALGGDWSPIATVAYQAGAWDYRITSPRLDDLADYAWRVSSVDAAGNVGSATSLTARTIVRTPDAPEFTATFDDGTTKVTFAEAA